MKEKEKDMKDISHIAPFENCPALDGYHCQTNALAKIYLFHNHPLSEDMLLGLGAGMGFIYWRMKFGKSTHVFMGGRGNTKGFFDDLGSRTGVKMKVVSTTSTKKAEAFLLKKLEQKEPVMLFGDMAYLPWFEFPEEYHFGGHTFVVCGYDGKGNVLASDMDQKASGLKKGFYHPITLEQLKKARGSPHKPFPPKNACLEFDFTNYHEPSPEDIYSSIQQTVEALLQPPIKNIGVKGLRHSAREIEKWPGVFDDHDLRMNLFSIYIFFEIGGTGGGCFRYMYSRFLKEAAEITQDDRLSDAAKKIHRAGEMYTEIGLLFREAEVIDNIDERIVRASEMFLAIADLEEEVLSGLSNIVSGPTASGGST
jgi:hypothetical protein